MKKKILWMTFVAVTFSTQFAIPQETLVDHLVNACASDIQNFCSQVTPGNGRLVHCMAAHEDKISGRCEYAFYQAATVLEQLSVGIAYVARECKTDIETLCSDVVAGDGRILFCLDEHEEDVGEGCKVAIADTVGE